MRKSHNKTGKAISFDHVGMFYPKKASIFGRFQVTNGYWALNDVSFEINHGDVLGIIGNNGAGKSTTLALISGIIKETKGKVETYGNKCALLSINSGFVTSLSGKKNIMLLGLALGVQKKKIQQAMDSIIEFSELGDFIHEPVETYSSGMKTRLGFSTAIMLEPEILLIDEVLGVGDRNFKKKSSAIMKQKLSGENTAIIVSHSENTILEHTNKCLWIEKGTSMAFGNSKDVMKEYISFCEKSSK